MEISALIKVARGEEPAELLLKNAKVINVFSGEIEETSIAITHSRVVGLGEYNAQRVIDLGGAYVCPGFIDAHVHIESAMVPPYEFARGVVPSGDWSTRMTSPTRSAPAIARHGPGTPAGWPRRFFRPR